MAPPYSKQVPLSLVTYGIEQTQARMRVDVESIWSSVFDSHRTILEAHRAMARADEVLARRMSEGPLEFADLHGSAD